MFNFRFFVAVSAMILLGVSVTGCRNEATTPKTDDQRVRKTEGSGGHHPPGYATSGLHGKQYMADKKSCTECHGADLKGGAMVAFSCNKCHVSFPHSAEFKDIENDENSKIHGAAYFADRLECTKCHGADYKGGESKVSCQKCHTYPHNPKWAQPQIHGGVYVADLKKQRETMDEVDWGEAKAYEYDKCMKCHGEGKKSLKSRHPKEHVACGSCHMPMPHMVRVQRISKRGRTKWDHHSGYGTSFRYGCLKCHSQMGIHPDSDEEELLYNRLSPSTEGKGCYFCHDEFEGLTIGFPQIE